MIKTTPSLFIVISFTIFFFSCNNHKQNTNSVQNIKNIYQAELENTTWITNNILGLDINTEKYILTNFVERKFAGNLTIFSNKTGSYTSKYIAPCGNDYFTTVNGKYKFLDKNTITISVDSVTYYGEWNKPTEYRKAKELTFSISKSNDRITLTKTNSK